MINVRQNDRNLAESLISRLGAERALRLARLNRWYGVVEAIQRMEDQSVIEVAAFRAGFRRQQAGQHSVPAVENKIDWRLLGKKGDENDS